MKADLRNLCSLLLVCCSPGALADVHGTPWKRHIIDDTSRGADGTRLADVNGDDLPDIATGWEEGGIVRVYIHPGAERVKEPWPAVTVGKVGSPEDAVLTDLDRDGALDVVSSCEGSTMGIFAHWAPKESERYLDAHAWSSEPFPAVERRARWMYCLPLQVDGEHGVDLVLGAKGPGAQVGWLEAPARARDLAGWKWHPIYEAGWIMSIVALDMDGDSDDDLLVSDRKGGKRGCLWLERPEFLSKPWKEHRIGAGDQEVMFLTPGDLDTDGHVDVIVAVRDRKLVYHRRTPQQNDTQQNDSWQSSTIPLPQLIGTAKAVAVGDINGDKRLDVVVSCENARDRIGVFWLSRGAAGLDDSWTAHNISGPEGTKFDLVRLRDLDLDGDLDVLSCEERENLGVVWYENPSMK